MCHKQEIKSSIARTGFTRHWRCSSQTSEHFLGLVNLKPEEKHSAMISQSITKTIPLLWNSTTVSKAKLIVATFWSKKSFQMMYTDFSHKCQSFSFLHKFLSFGGVGERLLVWLVFWITDPKIKGIIKIIGIIIIRIGIVRPSLPSTATRS